jgi:hypothetical protein
MIVKNSFCNVCAGWFLAIFLFSACSQNNRSINTVDIDLSQHAISIEKLDSISISFLGNPTVHDLDPISRTIIFMEHGPNSEDIYIADFDGGIRSSYSKVGDVPDTYGILMSSIKISDQNSFLVYGYRGFFNYDFSGNLISQVGLENFEIPSQRMLAMGFGMENSGHRYLYINQAKIPTELDSIGKFKLLVWLDPKSGKREPIINFPEESIFLNGNFFFMRSWFPIFTVSDERIYVVFGSEPTIYVYQNQFPYALEKRIPLTLNDYALFGGAEEINDEKLFGMSMISGRVENIKKVNGFFIVAYFPGYDKIDVSTNFEHKTSEEALVFRERMLEKYRHRIAIVDTLGNVLNDFVPDGLDPSSMLLRDGQLWMMEKPNENQEQDYFRLFRVALKVEKN